MNQCALFLALFSLFSLLLPGRAALDFSCASLVPIPWLRVSADGTLSESPEGIAALQSLDGPIFPVAIAGIRHARKTTTLAALQQLLITSQSCCSGFRIGHDATNTTTRGMDFLAIPLHWIKPNARGTLLLIDVEGMLYREAAVDQRLSGFVKMVASTMIMNVKDILDNTLFEALATAVAVSERLNNSTETPHLMVLVQDGDNFKNVDANFQATSSLDAELERRLALPTFRESTKLLMHHFPNRSLSVIHRADQPQFHCMNQTVHCEHPSFTTCPGFNDHKYWRSLRALAHILLTLTLPKQSGGHPVDGNHMADLTVVLVPQLNRGDTVINVPDMLQTVRAANWTRVATKIKARINYVLAHQDLSCRNAQVMHALYTNLTEELTVAFNGVPPGDLFQKLVDETSAYLTTKYENAKRINEETCKYNVPTVPPSPDSLNQSPLAPNMLTTTIGTHKVILGEQVIISGDQDSTLNLTVVGRHCRLEPGAISKSALKVPGRSIAIACQVLVVPPEGFTLDVSGENGGLGQPGGSGGSIVLNIRNITGGPLSLMADGGDGGSGRNGFDQTGRPPSHEAYVSDCRNHHGLKGYPGGDAIPGGNGGSGGLISANLLNLPPSYQITTSARGGASAAACSGGNGGLGGEGAWLVIETKGKCIRRGPRKYVIAGPRPCIQYELITTKTRCSAGPPGDAGASSDLSAAGVAGVASNIKAIVFDETRFVLAQGLPFAQYLYQSALQHHLQRNYKLAADVLLDVLQLTPNLGEAGRALAVEVETRLNSILAGRDFYGNSLNHVYLVKSEQVSAWLNLLSPLAEYFDKAFADLSSKAVTTKDARSMATRAVEKLEAISEAATVRIANLETEIVKSSALLAPLERNAAELQTKMMNHLTSLQSKVTQAQQLRDRRDDSDDGGFFGFLGGILTDILPSLLPIPPFMFNAVSEISQAGSVASAALDSISKPLPSLKKQPLFERARKLADKMATTTNATEVWSKLVPRLTSLPAKLFPVSSSSSNNMPVNLVSTETFNSFDEEIQAVIATASQFSVDPTPLRDAYNDHQLAVRQLNDHRFSHQELCDQLTMMYAHKNTTDATLKVNKNEAAALTEETLSSERLLSFIGAARMETVNELVFLEYVKDSSMQYEHLQRHTHFHPDLRSMSTILYQEKELLRFEALHDLHWQRSAQEFSNAQVITTRKSHPSFFAQLSPVKNESNRFAAFLSIDPSNPTFKDMFNVRLTSVQLQVQYDSKWVDGPAQGFSHLTQTGRDVQIIDPDTKNALSFRHSPRVVAVKCSTGYDRQQMGSDGGFLSVSPFALWRIELLLPPFATDPNKIESVQLNFDGTFHPSLSA